jgi:mono/diheme cytochrome c family protein
MQRKLAVVLIPAVVATIMLSRQFSAAVVETQTAQAGNTDSRSVWDGIYAANQATQGKAQYEAKCSSCHGADLSGGLGQALKGDVFVSAWKGYPLNSLFSRIKSTMPSGAPATLSNEAYLEIVTYLLQTNAFPAGTAELKTDALESIRIEGKEGPLPIPNFALVRVVGCLTEGSGDAWMLNDASEPVRTREPESSKDEELKNSIARRSGTQQFRLMNIYPSPGAYKGQKVEVKGYLIKAPNEHINVNALQPLASTCGRSDIGIELPEGEAKVILERACTTCHDLGSLKLFQGYYTEERWRSLILDMVKVGAQVNSDEISTISKYLEKYFGPEKR